MAKLIKGPKLGWADRRIRDGRSYTRNAVSVRRAIDVAAEKAGHKSYNDLVDHVVSTSIRNNVPMESSNDKFDAKTGLFANKGKKDGRCNRTACQKRIGSHPELREPAQQWVMRPPFTSGEELFYCSACANLFLESDRRFREPDRVSLYVASSAAA